MEEQKKKGRPTWKMVGALNKQVADLREELCIIHLKYKHLTEEYNSQKNLITTLEQSNQLMEEEMNRVKKDRDHLSSLHSKLSIENLRLKTRGFFARVFNVF